MLFLKFLSFEGFKVSLFRQEASRFAFLCFSRPSEDVTRLSRAVV